MKSSHPGWIRRLDQRFREWMCRTFGHAFTTVDLLRFKIESEGRCFTINLLTGERRPWAGSPKITCRRCGKVFTEQDHEKGDEGN